MPLYEYICTACDHHFEEMQKFSDKPIRKCPVCGKNKVEKKISLAGFQLKGVGWYKDGYNKPTDKKSTDATTVKTETSAPTKTEAAAPVKKPDSTPAKNTTA